MNKTDQIISELLEDEDDEDDMFDVEDAKDMASHSIEPELHEAGFELYDPPSHWKKAYGYHGREVVSIYTFAPNEFGVIFWTINLNNGTGTVIREFSTNRQGAIKVIQDIAPKKVTEGLEDDEDDFDTKEVINNEGVDQIYQLVDSGVLSISGSVKRTSNHYVHERSTTFTLESDFNWDHIPTDEDSKFEENVGKILNDLEQQVNEEMVAWNHKMYLELESAWEYEISDENAVEAIKANEYEFDEDGARDQNGEFQYDQLSPDAQAKAKEWWLNSKYDDGDTYWSELIIAEWKWLLKNKGFDEVEIAFRGFSSQGDGASFTARSFDLKRYLTGTDPLLVPEGDRGQIDESEEEPDDEDEAKDVYDVNRINLKHIETEQDYAEYKQRVSEFFDREHVTDLSAMVDEHDNPMVNEFSWYPCDVCHRPLGGRRTDMSGYDPETKEIKEYTVCSDCEQYLEYGQLDDTTLMDLKKTDESVDDDEDFETKEVLSEPPEPGVFQVFSSHGQLSAYVEDGTVKIAELNDEADEDGQTMLDIARFNVEEWKKVYYPEKIKNGQCIDILDIGFWSKDGLYEPPDEDWRREFAKEKHAPEQANPEEGAI